MVTVVRVVALLTVKAYVYVVVAPTAVDSTVHVGVPSTDDVNDSTGVVPESTVGELPVVDVRVVIDEL